MWINWASRQFHLVDNGAGGGGGGKLAKAFEDLRGESLLTLSLAEVAARISSVATPNIPFFTHFELLKSCHEVCKLLCFPPFLFKAVFTD